MPKITTFDKRNLTQFRADFATATAQLQKDYGVVLSVGRVTFTPTTFRCKLEAQTTSNTSIIVPGSAGRETIEAQNFVHLNYLHGLPTNVLGAKFTSQGKSFIVTGYSPSKRKYPIMAKTLTGRRFKFAVSTIRTAIAANQITYSSTK